MACLSIINDGCPEGQQKQGGIGLGSGLCVPCGNDGGSQSAGDLVDENNGDKKKGDFWKNVFDKLPDYLNAGANVINSFKGGQSNNGDVNYYPSPKEEPPKEEKDNSVVILIIVILFILAIMFFLFRRRPQPVKA